LKKHWYTASIADKINTEYGELVDDTENDCTQKRPVLVALTTPNSTCHMD
jgi:hypothetical protein